MFRSRRCQARVARALVARVGLERLWTDEGPTPEARLLREAEHLPLAARERALCRLAWLIWDGTSEITLGDLLDLTDGEDLATVASLLRAMSLGADAVDAWLEGRAGRTGPASRAADGEPPATRTGALLPTADRRRDRDPDGAVRGPERPPLPSRPAPG